MEYARMATDEKGYFSVTVLDVVIGGVSLREMGGDVRAFNVGKGTIVDSGTTDSYLPGRLAGAFLQAFAKATGGMRCVLFV